jgi:hypothetical protein
LDGCEYGVFARKFVETGSDNFRQRCLPIFVAARALPAAPDVG